GLRGVGNSQSGEDPLPVGDREEFELPRQFDRGRSHTASSVAGFRGDANDANVNILGSSAAGGRTGPTVVLGAPRELRTHLSHQRREFPRGLRSGTNARRDDMNLKSTLTGRRLLLQIHALYAFASRAGAHLRRRQAGEPS